MFIFERLIKYVKKVIFLFANNSSKFFKDEKNFIVFYLTTLQKTIISFKFDRKVGNNILDAVK